MVLKPVIMNYETTEINFEKESERYRLLHNKTIHNISFKIIQSPNEKNLQEQEISNTTK